MDQGRKFDLEEITEAIQNARSTAERQYYEKIAYRVIGESEDVRYWREELMKAIRADATTRKKYCIAKIQKINLDTTSGNSWGNNKGNRMVN